LIRSRAKTSCTPCISTRAATASGNGGPFLKDSDTWLSFLTDNGISWVNWSLCDKNETSAAFKPDVFKGNLSYAPTAKGLDGTKAWDAKDLSISGASARSKIQGDAQ
jgi:endoglucanase